MVAPLVFPRPAELQASAPPEARGLPRDGVRLLVSSPGGHRHARFGELPEVLEPGDLLVVNRSATLPAALPLRTRREEGLLHLSTRYGGDLWLAEPRRSPAEPGPLRLGPGERGVAGGVGLRFLAPHAGIPRLWFVAFEGPVEEALERHGAPIRYGYATPRPLADYQTAFADRPGSAEMPSAGRPFTPRLLEALEERGVGLARITLHTGVSSLETSDVTDAKGNLALYAEPFEVSEETARAIARTRAAGRRVVAVGTTVVRALESAWQDGRVRPARGFTRLAVVPGAFRGSVDGLLTGLHDPGATHLAMLEALAGRTLVEEGYREALREGYLWHEFGDSHLLLPERRAGDGAAAAA